MRSIKAAAQCIGLEGSFWVAADFYGHTNVPGRVQIGTYSEYDFGDQFGLSLQRQLDRLRGRHVHLNMIRVGEGLGEDFDDSLDGVIVRMRLIFSTYGMGIGRIQHYHLDDETAGDFSGHFLTQGEVKELVRTFYVDNDGIDVFWVDQLMMGENLFGPTLPCVYGMAVLNDSCDKTSKNSMGVVVYQGAGAKNLCHELGHVLRHDKGHDEDVLHLMHKDAFKLGIQLRASEIEKMMEHCAAQPGCEE